jgi:glutamate synthase domain-containing protein 3
MIIDAKGLDFTALNKLIKSSDGDCEINGCLGQRFVADGLDSGKVVINGIPGNALGAYLNGAEITVCGNAQDAVGDTMNDGKIIVHGSIGDTAGYAMRGGEIYVEKNAGYRAGIHMKEYRDKKPVIVIGGRTGSFLGEYQAGGLIIVLGMNEDDKPTVGKFPCTGMHGGKMVIRGSLDGIQFPQQVTLREATDDDMAEIMPFLKSYCDYFDFDISKLTDETFTVITPDSRKPYKQMYVAN